MRLWQYYAVRELSNYGMTVLDISSATGLTTVAVANIQGGAFLPYAVMMHVDGDFERCPICGSHTLSPCFCCYSTLVGMDKPVEVIERPLSHQNFMLNVHMLSSEEIVTL